MPLGNMTSQFFANVYLNPLDRFIKHKLKMKYYIRYVDDFVILYKDRRILEKCKSKIRKYLMNLKLELHPNKSKIFPIYRGVDLLGFKVFYFYRRVRKRNVKQFYKNLIRNKIQYKERVISYKDFLGLIQRWCAYIMWGDTYSLRKNIAQNIIKFLEFDAKKPLNDEEIYKIAKLTIK